MADPSCQRSLDEVIHSAYVASAKEHHPRMTASRARKPLRAKAAKARRHGLPPPGEIRKFVAKSSKKSRRRHPQVSSHGRFRSTDGVVSRPKPRTSKYANVRIDNHAYKLHALVTRAFCGRPDTSEHTADHIDNDPSNNHATNLRWASKSEQIQHSYTTNPDRESNGPRQSKPLLARKVTADAATAGQGKKGADDEEDGWTPYESGYHAARELGLHRSNISACLNGRKKTTRGYEFKPDPTAAEPERLEGEEWRNVVVGDDVHEVRSLMDYEFSKGRHHPQISSFGRFRSLMGVISTSKPDPDGYCYKKIVDVKYSVHGLVGRAFLPEPGPGQTTVDHIDNDPSNNHVSNLRWASRSEQIQHSYATNPDRESSGPRQSKPLLARKVTTAADAATTGQGKKGADDDEDGWTPYESGYHAARELGLHRSNISACLNGRKKTTRGYEFKPDPTAAEPERLEGEEWRDVVVAD